MKIMMPGNNRNPSCRQGIVSRPLARVGEKPYLAQAVRAALILTFVVGLALGLSSPVLAAAQLTITPITWNVIGLDSNNVNVGPNNFPVGAHVCNTGNATANNVVSAFVWDSSDPYIDLRSGSLSTQSVTSLAANTCTDFYYEVQITRDTNAYNHTRQYHITADSDETTPISTTTPREVYVEHLISQSRNGTTSVKLNGASIPAGGSMTLVVGNTYTIELAGFTATNGYNQLESFINFPNTIFQILAVSTTYSTSSIPTVSNPNPGLYADACVWDNDPASANYRSCVGPDYKAGGNVTMTYTVKIIGGGGTSQNLYSLLYDFSGSSYHYNSDYATSYRIGNIVNPTNVGISKSFTPSSTIVNGISVLTITLSNPNPGPLSGYNFTDPLPANLIVATPAAYSTFGCGTPTFAPTAGATSLSFSNGTVAADSTCTISVNVTPTAAGPFLNTTNNLFINSLDTGKNASATLTTTTFPPPVPPSTCAQKVEIARWSMALAQGTATPPAYFTKATDVATAIASAGLTGSGSQTISSSFGNPVNSWGITDVFPSTVNVPPGGVAPYFDFLLDTSKYGGITITFDADLEATGDWASQQDNHLFIYSSANGGTYSLLSTLSNINKGSWIIGNTATNLSSGTSTTAFRINVDSRNSQKASSTVYLDNIVFTGCPVPPNPPTLSKSFSPNPVKVGGNSTLTFTITNPNTVGTSYNNTLTGIAFSDTLPAGMVLASAPSTPQCGGTVTGTPGQSLITFSGGTLAAGPSSCTVIVTVTATTAGPHTNVSGFISSSQTGTNSTSTGFGIDTLVAVAPPSISKIFTPSPIISGGTSTLTFTITNPNQNNALNSVAFSDTLPTSPGNMLVSTPNGAVNNCGGTFAATAGSGSVSLSGVTLAAGASCTVSVNVTATTTGTYNNTSGNVSHVINGETVNGNTASASLTVNAPAASISILKQVSTSSSGPWRTFISVPVGTSVFYRFVIENTGQVALSPVSVSDPTLASGSANPATCTWTPNSNPPASVPPLPVAAPNMDPVAFCIKGPISAVLGTHQNTATAHGTYNSAEYDSSPSTASYTASAPTLAGLLSVDARDVKNGVSVKWETGSELTMTGFNVWRKSGKHEWKKLNAEVIQAKEMGKPNGAKYNLLDRTAKPGHKYRYKLEILTTTASEWSEVVKNK